MAESRASRGQRLKRPRARGIIGVTLLTVVGLSVVFFLHALHSATTHSYRVVIAEGSDIPLQVITLSHPYPPEEFPDNPETTKHLPFTFRLEAVRKQTIAGIAIREGALEEQVTAAVGDTVMVGDTSLTLSEVAPWTGLMPSPNGLPMAHLYLDEAEGAANVFLPDGQWVTLQNGSKGLLIWHESEDVALAACNRKNLGLQYARWGVTEGARTSWFSVFIPGTGVDLDDGGQVVLVDVIEEGGALRVAVATEEGWEERRIPANNAEADPLVHFENFTVLPSTIVLDAWEANAAVATCFHHGARVEQIELVAGESWSTSCLSARMWLASLYASAVPAYPQEEGPLGAVLEGPNRRYVISAMQQERIGDATVVFLGEEETVWRYTLEIVKPGEERAIQAVVSTVGEPLVAGDWQISALPPSGEHPQAAHLLVEPRVSWGDKW